MIYLHQISLVFLGVVYLPENDFLLLKICGGCKEFSIESAQSQHSLDAPRVVLGELREFIYVQLLEANTDIVNRPAAYKDHPRNQVE